MTASERPKRIADLAKSALELLPEDWPAYLDEACGADKALRAFRQPASQFIEEDALHVVAQNIARDLPLGVEQRIGDYHILSRIGAGGMGDVTSPKTRSFAAKWR